jgi:glutamyl-tRNA synthetase
VQEWLARTDDFSPADFKSVEGPLLELDAHLTLRSYIVGYSLTVADLAIWGAIRGNRVAAAAVKRGTMQHLTRWSKFIEETNPWIGAAVQSLNAAAAERKMAKSKEGGSYDISLKDTDKGVVTRFPPEPSLVLRLMPCGAVADEGPAVTCTLDTQRLRS